MKDETETVEDIAKLKISNHDKMQLFFKREREAITKAAAAKEADAEAAKKAAAEGKPVPKSNPYEPYNRLGMATDYMFKGNTMTVINTK